MRLDAVLSPGGLIGGRTVNRFPSLSLRGGMRGGWWVMYQVIVGRYAVWTVWKEGVDKLGGRCDMRGAVNDESAYPQVDMGIWVLGVWVCRY